MKTIGQFCLGVAIVYIAICVVMYLLQREFIYKPTDIEPDISSLGYQNISKVEIVTQDKIIIHGYMIESGAEKAPVVVFFQGNSGDIADRAHKLKPILNKGYDVFYVGYRGYGGNPGSPTEDSLTKDANDWMSWLTKVSGVEDRPIILYGESLGTGLAVKMAKTYPAKALILEAPYSSVSDIAKSRYGFLPVDLLLKDEFRSGRHIQQISTPVLIVHGTKDKVIPIKYGKKLYGLAGDPKIFLEIDGADHNNLYDYSILDRIDVFIKESLKG